MSDSSPADLYLARIAARPPRRWTIYTVFLLTAIASFYLRVVEGRPDQALPGVRWYGAFLALYGFGMAVMARDLRCRAVYACFGLLVAASFTRPWLPAWTRPVGVLEVAASLCLLAAFANLVRDERSGLPDAVLQSGAPKKSAYQEDDDEQARSRRDPGRDDGHRLGSGQGH